MSPAAFLPGEGAGDNGFRNIQKGLELEGLDEIRIKHLAFILHHDRRGTMGQYRECGNRSRHGFVRPNEAKVEAHHLAELFSNLPGSDRSLLCHQLLDTRLLGDELVWCACLWRNGSSIFSGSDSSAPTEHNGLKK